jgi:Flp pilus assembly protein TadB
MPLLYRILMRLAAVLAAIPLVALVLVAAMSPGPVHLHTDAVGLVVVFGAAALVAAIAWIVKPRTAAGQKADD